ncbi:hypothetical protein BJY04DRAFT_89375 [Aspergillus karnatakaensis]|uniref:uncharacterized protein n=1 Tax=Aspergillus karnatakaensis TaxID=1810916 RepID=UPI003CCD0E8F
MHSTQSSHHDRKRRRVNVACNRCRSHKVRCDGARPDCGNCRRHREICLYNDEASAPISDSPGAQAGQDENTQSHLDYTIAEPMTSGDRFEPEATAMGLAARMIDHADESGEVFYGNSSAISFVKSLQDSLRSKNPTSGLPNGLNENAPRRAADRSVLQPTKISLDLLPPRDLADHLVDCYFRKIHTLYPFVHKDAFLESYSCTWSSDPSGVVDSKYIGLGLGDPTVTDATWYYALNIVFAMGCQFSELLRAERQVISEGFFHRCKQALDVDYLERGDLALVQVILLISHYLQGSQTPNRCWHVIGTACRLAQAIGLHSSIGDERRSFAQKQIRRRVWHGCRMLDLGASTMLGRPPMTSNRLSVPLPVAIDDHYLNGHAEKIEQPRGTFSSVEWFIATLKLHDLLRKMIILYEDLPENSGDAIAAQGTAINIHQVQCITEIELELDNFHLSLPKQLNWEGLDLKTTIDPYLREKCLLKARFIYLKLLAFKPFLSQSVDQVRATTTHPRSSPDTQKTGIYSNLTLNCSVLCVQSAVDLTSLVHYTCATDLASVWFYNIFYVFTAGLVLILAEFQSEVVKIVTREALDLAWHKCQLTLEYLETNSIVAERCARSLSDIKAKCSRIQTRSGSNSYQSDNGFTPAFDGAQGVSESFSESVFGDIDLNNISLDWSWFNIDY